MNHVDLIGRLTNDPDVRYSSQDGTIAVAHYTMAVNRPTKKDAEPMADFIRCVAFGKAAEFAEKYLRKGMKIAVSGRILTGSYTNNEGNKVYTFEVAVNEHEFCESKSAQSNDANSAAVPSTDANGFMDIPDGISEELPFN